MFSVSSEDLLTDADVCLYWREVEAADRREVSSFVLHRCFALDLASNPLNTVAAIWVRRWTGQVIKSRCCGRGFLDTQCQSVDKHSSTASILNHRRVMTLAAQYDWDVATLGVSTAFLQGLKLKEM